VGAPDAGPAGSLSKRDALHAEVTHAVLAPGLIAYLDDHPVGWTRVGPRSTLPGVLGNRALARVLEDDDGVWWVTCFKVDSRLPSRVTRSTWPH
jgi:hypothetical protein